MKYSSHEDALRQIQEIVTHETGAPLHGEAVQQVQDLLVNPAKPVSDVWRPELVALPHITFTRRTIRACIRRLTKLLTVVIMRTTIRGLENFPKQGPTVIVINHIGDLDVFLVIASLPITIEGIAKIELNDHWLIGPVFRAYGVIWVHRGTPDRTAIRAALNGLSEGRMIVLAPEGRESLIGGLENGNKGAAFLAIKSGAPVVPIAITGTENKNIYRHLKKLKRTQVTLSVGKPFVLFPQGHPLTKRKEMLREGTNQIMQSLASLLPESYRGNYS